MARHDTYSAAVEAATCAKLTNREWWVVRARESGELHVMPADVIDGGTVHKVWGPALPDPCGDASVDRLERPIPCQREAGHGGMHRHIADGTGTTWWPDDMRPLPTP